MTILKTIKSTAGNSLAEFAVVIALMATLMSTGQVKFSQAGEGGKGKKSGEEMDKIAKAANNFYNAMNQEEGAGRFPGQDKWDVNVPKGGGYSNSTSSQAGVDAALTVLTGLDANGAEVNDGVKWDSYEDIVYSTSGDGFHGEGLKWCSVFGKDNEDAEAVHGSFLAADDDFTLTGDMTTDDLTNEDQYSGPGEFQQYIDPVKSPFLDGHFIYTVIGGDIKQSPTLIVTDLMDPSAEFIVVQP